MPGGNGAPALPAQPGSYALLLRAESGCFVTAGRLGMLVVRPGCYVYVGSALGPGGLAGRMQHHLRPAARPHWHIDYLRQAAQISEIWYMLGTACREHSWARLLHGAPGSSVPLAGFGASDCSCPSHLFHFAAPPPIATLLSTPEQIIRLLL